MHLNGSEYLRSLAPCLRIYFMVNACPEHRALDVYNFYMNLAASFPPIQSPLVATSPWVRDPSSELIENRELVDWPDLTEKVGEGGD